MVDAASGGVHEPAHVSRQFEHLERRVLDLITAVEQRLPVTLAVLAMIGCRPGFPVALERFRADLETFAAEIFGGFARSDQRVTGLTYLRGLMLDGQRKSMQPMAERLGTDHQRLQQFLTSSTWDYAAVRRRLVAKAVQVVDPDVWIVDDTGFPKAARHPRGWPGSTRAPWARLRTVRSRYRCTPPPSRPRRCWTGGCSCRPRGTRRACLTRTGRSPTSSWGASH